MIKKISDIVEYEELFQYLNIKEIYQNLSKFQIKYKFLDIFNVSYTNELEQIVFEKFILIGAFKNKSTANIELVLLNNEPQNSGIIITEQYQDILNNKFNDYQHGTIYLGAADYISKKLTYEKILQLIKLPFKYSDTINVLVESLNK